MNVALEYIITIGLLVSAAVAAWAVLTPNSLFIG